MIHSVSDFRPTHACCSKGMLHVRLLSLFTDVQMSWQVHNKSVHIPALC